MKTTFSPIKAIIKEKISSSTYLVEDISNGEIIIMLISGKQRIFPPEICKEVYVEINPNDTNKGRWLYKGW